MSITITEYTFGDSELSWLEKVVVEKIYLLDNDFEKGCWASAQYLGDFFGVKETTMRNALSSLAQKGKIERIWSNGRKRGYRSLLHPLKNFVSLKNDTYEELEAEIVEVSPEASLKSDTYETDTSETDQNHAEVSFFSDTNGKNENENAPKRHFLVTQEASFFSDTTNRDKDDLLNLNSEEKDNSYELSKKKQEDAKIVFNYWKIVFNHPKAKYSPDKKQKIVARITEGFTVSELKQAINGNKASPYHQGKNADGKIYDSIDLIFRNATKTEGFIALANRPNGAKTNESATTINGANQRANAIIADRQRFESPTFN